jgi:pilus assembly protein CpaC
VIKNLVKVFFFMVASVMLSAQAQLPKDDNPSSGAPSGGATTKKDAEEAPPGSSPIIGGPQINPPPPEGTRKEKYLDRELEITTQYVTLSSKENRIVKLKHRFGDKFDNLRGVISSDKVSTLKDKNQVLLEAKGEGTGDILIFDSDSADSASRATRLVVSVAKTELTQKVDAIRQLVGDVEGLEIKVVGNKIILDGEILVPSEFKRVLRVYDRYAGDDVYLLATLSPLALEMIASRIKQAIGQQSYVDVRVLNNQIVLEGTANSVQEAERYLSIARSFLPEKVEIPAPSGGSGVRISRPDLPTISSLLTIASTSAPQPGKMVRVTVHYVEIDSDYANNFNFNWSPTLNVNNAELNYRFNKNNSSADTPNGLTTTFLSTLDNLLPKLTTARSHSHARILKTSTMLVKDSAQDETIVKSTLSVPYKIVTSVNGTTQITESTENINNETKIGAQVLPGKNAAQKDVLELSISIALSNLISASTAGARPQVSANSMASKVVVADGESVAVGGLINDDQRAAYNKDSPSAAGTRIFNLQRQKDYGHNKSQFIVFVTPQIIRSIADDTEEMKRKFRLRRGVSSND